MRLFIGVNPTLNKQLPGDALRIVASLDGLPLDSGEGAMGGRKSISWEFATRRSLVGKWAVAGEQAMAWGRVPIVAPTVCGVAFALARTWFRLNRTEHNNSENGRFGAGGVPV